VAKAAKKAKKAKTKTRGATRGAARGVSRAPERHEEDPIDGCDVEFTDDDATPDADLPPARGGVESPPAKRR
jgi:hypothetical protein